MQQPEGAQGMISRLSHTTIYVLDQDAALAFYTDKLGFAVRTDQTMGDFRWLSVGPPGQPDLEIVLYQIAPSPMMDDATAAQLKALVARGAMGTGVFATDDCRATYEALRAKGVEFLSAPEEQPYGTEAVFKDNSGNWFSLTQRPA
jgi:catechol 2,3-dioxygenase-like lactoylglutathione lyase family enzyme